MIGLCLFVLFFTWIIAYFIYNSYKASHWYYTQNLKQTPFFLQHTFLLEFYAMTLYSDTWAYRANLHLPSYLSNSIFSSIWNVESIRNTYPSIFMLSISTHVSYTILILYQSPKQLCHYPCCLVKAKPCQIPQNRLNLFSDL